MSNEIKMSDVLSIGGNTGDAVYMYMNGYGNLTQEQKDEVCRRYNTHDQHVERIAELEDMLILTYESVRKDYKNGTLDSGLNWSVYSSELNKLMEQSK